MKIDKSTAHVCLGSNEVNKGDEIIFYENFCTGAGGEDGSGAFCELEKLGVGKISKTINGHYSIVKTDGSFKFDEGALVEKK